MNTVQSEQTLEQLRLTLEQERRELDFHGPVWALWGLIISKILLVEWAIRNWEMPISSFYVWAPTLLIGGACTAVLAIVTGGARSQRPATSRFLGAVWGGVALVLAALALASVWGGVFSPWLLPGLAALLYGVGAFAHGSLADRPPYRIAAFLWWGGAAALLAWPGLHGLAVLGGLVLVGHVVPVCIRWWTQRRDH